MLAEPVVLASYLAGEGHFTSDIHRVIPIRCDADEDYSLGVAAWWEHAAPIVNLEHDLEVTDREISDLLACPHSLCAHNYPMHWISTGNPNEVLPHTMNGKFVQEGDEWAEWSAIGLVKIALEARTGSLYPCHWHQVEDAIDKAVTGLWHLHGPPLKHHHW